LNVPRNAQAFQDSVRSQPWLILAAVIAVYIVCGCPLREFHPSVTIMFNFAVRGLGALLSIMLFGQDLSVISMIGSFLLIGIVKKNGS